MVILRRLVPVFQYIKLSPRFYARKTVATTDADMKQVHQEILRYIYPYATIKVDSDIYLKVTTADPIKYPSGDAFIAELHGDPVKNCTASMVVKVSADERIVEVVLKKLTDSVDFHCELAIPVQASLDINTRDAASVSNTLGDKVTVIAEKFIKTENVRAEEIKLFSRHSDIICKGILLGKQTDVQTQDKGNIVLNKLHGENIKCKTNEGDITTNCSYVDKSEFSTDNGNLDLKNVHKTAVVYIHRRGNLKMTGVNGNLKVFVNEGALNVQLSELHGINTIEGKNLTSCVINISDEIEKTTSMHVALIDEMSDHIIQLDSTLEHLSSALEPNMKQLKWPKDQERQIKLKVIGQSSLILGKSSWKEMMTLAMTERKTH